MPRQSTHKKRSDGGSRSRTHGKEPSGRGSTSRNRNTSHTADRTRSRSNSNSESTHTRQTSSESRSGDSSQTSSESRSGDASQRSSESRSGDSGQTSSESRSGDSSQRSNEQDTPTNDVAPNADGPQDPDQRKRKLNQAIADVTSSSSAFKKLKSGTNSDIHDLHRYARGILRFIGPFIHIQSTFVSGSQLVSSAPNPAQPPSEPSSSDKNQALLDTYRKILAFVPGLDELTAWTQINDPSGIHALATFLDQSGSKGRSDDCASLREDTIGYIRQVKSIPEVEDVPDLDRKAKKETRGFNHHATACLLCPREFRDEFDKDREEFCRNVQNGTRGITHENWPSFLYPENGYNSNALDEGLLCSPLLVSCYRHIFTGARTALKATPGKAPGKKCVADLYNMTEVTPETIAYTAVLCRFVLNAKESWCTQDGPFHSNVFFDDIVALFSDEDWAKDTLTWWNELVFGNDPRTRKKDDSTATNDKQSSVARLAAQRAARQKANTAQPASTAQQPAPPASTAQQPAPTTQQPPGPSPHSQSPAHAPHGSQPPPPPSGEPES